MKLVLLVGLAGFIGTLLRFGCTRAADHFLTGFPWGTLLVNITGAFLAGFLFVYCRIRFQQYEEYFPVVFIGFLGAFTTFSTFALESMRFLMDAQYVRFICNVAVQNGTGLSAAGAGFLLTRHLLA